MIKRKKKSFGEEGRCGREGRVSERESERGVCFFPIVIITIIILIFVNLYYLVFTLNISLFYCISFINLFFTITTTTTTTATITTTTFTTIYVYYYYIIILIIWFIYLFNNIIIIIICCYFKYYAATDWRLLGFLMHFHFGTKMEHQEMNDVQYITATQVCEILNRWYAFLA